MWWKSGLAARECTPDIGTNGDIGGELCPEADLDDIVELVPREN
jgi:hypothetical protein